MKYLYLLMAKGRFKYIIEQTIKGIFDWKHDEGGWRVVETRVITDGHTPLTSFISKTSNVTRQAITNPFLAPLLTGQSGADKIGYRMLSVRYPVTLRSSSIKTSDSN